MLSPDEPVLVEADVLELLEEELSLLDVEDSLFDEEDDESEPLEELDDEDELPLRLSVT